jgi:YHS domain-containing protein
MTPILNITISVLLVLAAGCATSSYEAARNSGPRETCHVCRYNNDLACVCVTVTENTPKADYEGTTYYFCSEDCRTAFLKKSAKYAPKSPSK